MHRLRSLLAVALLLSPAACAKRSAAEAPAAPDMAYREGYRGASAEAEAGSVADYDDESANRSTRDFTAVVDMSPTASRDSAGIRLGGSTRSDSDGVSKVAMGSPPPRAAPAPQPPAEPAATGGQGEDKPKQPPDQFARQIIYIAELAISCFKLDEAMQRAEALTLETGGYVQTMSEGYFVLRIPAAQLRHVMAELAKLGVVESRSLQAQDVTQEYVDLSTRIRVLRETQAQLIALLKQARNVEEALQVRQSLDAITMDLEQTLGRLRMLENKIGFSTLTLRLSERGPQNAVPSSNDPFPWVDTLGVEATEWN